MRKRTFLHQIRISQTTRHLLSGLVLALLIVQWNVLQHAETHLSGNNSDSCEVCMLADHMASAMPFLPPSVADVPTKTCNPVPALSESRSSPIISFSVRAPPSS